MSNSRKRKFECLEEHKNGYNNHNNSYSNPPNKKQYIIKTLYKHTNDKKEFDIIYNTLKDMNNLKNISEAIIKVIAVFATGKIKLCDCCNTKEILCLDMEEANGRIT